MNNEHFHPILNEAPCAHALHRFDEATRTLTYEYNGVDIISMTFPECEELGFRHGSDGSMQSVAYAQQLYIMAKTEMVIDVQLTLTKEAVSMRDRRAQADQPILAQSGNVLIDGVTSLYDPRWDLLVSFKGRNAHWKDASFVEDGQWRKATLTVEVGRKPLFVNLLMHYYQHHLGYCYYHPWEKRPSRKIITGWCSWEAYRRDISQAKLDEITTFFSETLKPYGMEYILVDDGYQQMPLPANPQGSMKDGWMTCEPTKFPNGHAGIVSNIKKHGFKAAIWTNANITNAQYPTYHPDAVMHSGTQPMKGEWIDYLYSCTPQCLREEVVPIFEAYQQQGYDYIKIDAIRHLLFDGLHEAVRQGLLSNEEAQHRFRCYMEACRKGMGDNVYFSASWGEMHEVVSIADSCRISMDANPTWPGVRMQLFEMARWQHANNILFTNDPDHVCVRTQPQWARSILSLISLNGQVCLLSDVPDAYTPEKLEIIRKTIPPIASVTGETGPLSLDYPAYTWTKLHGFAVQSHETPVTMEGVDLDDALDMAGNYPGMESRHPFSSLWNFFISHGGLKWNVMARVATVPLAASTLTLEELNLNAAAQYLAFDFWKQEFLGVVSGTFDVPALELGDCQIVSLRERTGRVQFVASSRHVSMDAVSIRGITEEDDSLSMTIAGVVGTTEQYSFYVPDGLLVTQVSHPYEQDGPLLKVQVSFGQEMANLHIKFAHA